MREKRVLIKVTPEIDHATQYQQLSAINKDDQTQCVVSGFASCDICA